MKAPFASAIAIVVGLIVLGGYFIPYSPLLEIRGFILNWGVTLAGIAALVAIINLFKVHVLKLTRERHDRDFYSIFFILSFIITLCFGLYLSPSDPVFQRIVTRIQSPVETSLMAMLSISLAYASLRFLQRRRDFISILFVSSIVVFLVIDSGMLNLLGKWESFPGLFQFIKQIPAAGGRGILMGVALGTLTAGLRILIGADRPISG